MNKKIQRICEICGTSFEIWPSNLAVSENAGRFCSNKCRGVWRQGKVLWRKIDISNEAISSDYLAGSTLKQIATKHGMSITWVSDRLKNAGVRTRQPTGANLRHPAVIAKSSASHARGKNHFGFRDLPLNELKEAYESGQTLKELAVDYHVDHATIRNKLKSIGVQMRHAGFQRPVKCSDGHLAQSKYEVLIDEWLTANGLKHEIHPPCPWPPEWPVTHQESDFKVGEAYIEVWGVSANPTYEIRRQKKTSQYRAVGAFLIQIFPHHIYDHDYSPLEVLLTN